MPVISQPALYVRRNPFMLHLLRCASPRLTFLRSLQLYHSIRPFFRSSAAFLSFRMAFRSLPRVMIPVFLFTIVVSLSIQVQATILKRSTGALTPLSSKSKQCSVLDYGGVADGETDVGPAITKAFTDCVGDGSATLVIPDGNYSCKLTCQLPVTCKLTRDSGHWRQTHGSFRMGLSARWPDHLDL